MACATGLPKETPKETHLPIGEKGYVLRPSFGTGLPEFERTARKVQYLFPLLYLAARVGEEQGNWNA